MTTPFLNTEAILAVMHITELVVVISTTDSVVFITARMASTFVSSIAVHKYDFHIFTVITQYFCHIHSLHLLLKVYCAVPIMSTPN